VTESSRSGKRPFSASRTSRTGFRAACGGFQTACASEGRPPDGLPCGVPLLEGLRGGHYRDRRLDVRSTWLGFFFRSWFLLETDDLEDLRDTTVARLITDRTYGERVGNLRLTFDLSGRHVLLNHGSSGRRGAEACSTFAGNGLHPVVLLAGGRFRPKVDITDPSALTRSPFVWLLTAGHCCRSGASSGSGRRTGSPTRSWQPGYWRQVKLVVLASVEGIAFESTNAAI